MQLAILLLLAIFGCQPTIAANCTFVRPGLDVPNDGVNNPVYSEDQVIAIEWEWSDGMTSGDIIMWQDFPLNSDGTQLINHVEGMHFHSFFFGCFMRRLRLTHRHKITLTASELPTNYPLPPGGI